MLNSARRYSDRITLVSKDSGNRLIAHVYVRYLGDLSGGQVFARVSSKKTGFGPDQVAFYRFDDIEQLDTVKPHGQATDDRANRLVWNIR